MDYKLWTISYEPLRETTKLLFKTYPALFVDQLNRLERTTASFQLPNFRAFPASPFRRALLIG